MDQFGCPSDYDELVTQYTMFVRRVLKKVGINEGNLDDAAQEVFLKFYQRDFLSVYDPSKIHDTPKGKRTARFPTFLRRFAFLYGLDLRDRQRRRERLEPLYCDEMVPSADPASSAEALWIEVHGAPVPFDTLRFELSEEIVRARSHLAGVAVGTWQLDEVFDQMIAEAMETGTFHRARVAERMKKAGYKKPSVQVMSALIGAIRTELAAIGFQAVDEALPS